MKFLLLFGLLFFNIQFNFGFCKVNPVGTSEITSIPKTNNHRFHRKKRFSVKRYFKKLKHRVAKKFLSIDIDWDDPVKKWLWYFIFAMGISYILSLISFGVILAGGGLGAQVTSPAVVSITLILSIASGLLQLFALVSLIIWFVKKFKNK